MSLNTCWCKTRNKCITTICLLAYFFNRYIIINIIYLYFYFARFFKTQYTDHVYVLHVLSMFVLKVRFVAKLLQKVIQYWQHVPKRMWTLSRTTCIGWLGVFRRSFVQVRKGLLYQPSLLYIIMNIDIFIYIYTVIYMYVWDQDTINGLYLFECSPPLRGRMMQAVDTFNRHRSFFPYRLKAPECSETLSGWAQCRLSVDGAPALHR